MIHRWSIARRLFVANLLFMLALTAIVGTAVFVDARDHAYEEAGRRMGALATSIADNPLVLQAAGSGNPSAQLQPYALKVMADSGADFITIMAPDRTRWTHPLDEELGRPYIGSIQEALQGRVFTEITAGTLGPSVRTIAPVKDARGAVRALVAAGSPSIRWTWLCPAGCRRCWPSPAPCSRADRSRRGSSAATCGA